MAADSSTSAQRRRATKPLIEKRRRARINSSLAQLKEIVAKPCGKTQETRSNRLEKADILEMTVEYVKNIQDRKNFTDSPLQNPVEISDSDQFFKDGYKLCMSEVQNFFARNYRQQASKQFINRSLQNHLYQIYERTGASNSCRRPPNSREISEKSLTKYLCEAKELEHDAENLRKKEHYELHSEISDFSYSYSSASTDDEMTEGYSVAETESNEKGNESNSNRIRLQQQPLQYSTPSTNVDDKMWRPWSA